MPQLKYTCHLPSDRWDSVHIQDDKQLGVATAKVAVAVRSGNRARRREEIWRAWQHPTDIEMAGTRLLGEWRRRLADMCGGGTTLSPTQTLLLLSSSSWQHSPFQLEWQHGGEKDWLWRNRGKVIFGVKYLYELSLRRQDLSLQTHYTSLLGHVQHIALPKLVQCRPLTCLSLRLTPKLSNAHMQQIISNQFNSLFISS